MIGNSISAAKRWEMHECEAREVKSCTTPTWFGLGVEEIGSALLPGVTQYSNLPDSLHHNLLPGTWNGEYREHIFSHLSVPNSSSTALKHVQGAPHSSLPLGSWEDLRARSHRVVD